MLIESLCVIAIQRKAEEVEEAAEEEPVAAKEVAERPPKRRAVAKGKKAAEALQPVDHLSHQKVRISHGIHHTPSFMAGYNVMILAD